MRKVKIEDLKLKIVGAGEEASLEIGCPFAANIPDGVCYTLCAWFRAEKQRLDKTDNFITTVYCGDKLIGEIDETSQGS